MDFTKENCEKAFNKRDSRSHKGDFGKILIVAGSYGMMGAAILSAEAAIRSGAGLVTISCPADYFSCMHTAVPQVTCINRESLNFNRKNLEKYDAVAIGPGMGTQESTKDILETILDNFEGPIVIDADGLNVIRKYEITKKIKNYSGIITLTPHIGEAGRLLVGKKGGFYINRLEEVGIKSKSDILVGTEIKTLRLKIGHELAMEFEAISVLKGEGTVVSSVEKQFVNTSGNVGMATGGSGDVLTGIMVSFLGQWKKGLIRSPEEAVAASVYCHGSAGDFAAKKLGHFSLTALDIVRNLHNAMPENL